ncbi:hypothetical protein K461DRAFT_270061 [Myriangium duriaei CBS 260.36]|uniref:Uncharacterized protein n=1 Tax=Myriangium duriaei CBS 260.36 TaxID=1168546 RepID=A0A9P4MEZ2_9PEZI|nr:hypothetical protein K461DRAFT_270061 [Myriangium duriaei CBS 260.36]
MPRGRDAPRNSGRQPQRYFVYQPIGGDPNSRLPRAPSLGGTARSRLQHSTRTPRVPPELRMLQKAKKRCITRAPGPWASCRLLVTLLAVLDTLTDCSPSNRKEQQALPCIGIIVISTSDSNPTRTAPPRTMWTIAAPAGEPPVSRRVCAWRVPSTVV